MALILSVNTPLLWIAGTLHMGWADREAGASVGALAASLRWTSSAIRSFWRSSQARCGGSPASACIPCRTRCSTLLAQSGVPCALVALGASLTNFQIKGQAPTLTSMLLLKLVAMPLIAAVLAFKVFQLPPVAAGVVVLFAAMPTGANAYIFSMKLSARRELDIGRGGAGHRARRIHRRRAGLRAGRLMRPTVSPAMSHAERGKMRHANQRDAQSVEDYNLDDREKWAENGQRQAGTCNASQSVDGVSLPRRAARLCDSFRVAPRTEGNATWKGSNQYAFYDLGKTLRYLEAKEGGYVADQRALRVDRRTYSADALSGAG